jgi:hypothetical protein
MVSFMPLPLIPTRPDALLEPGHELVARTFLFARAHADHLPSIRDIRDELGNGMALVHVRFHSPYDSRSHYGRLSSVAGIE